MEQNGWIRAYLDASRFGAYIRRSLGFAHGGLYIIWTFTALAMTSLVAILDLKGKPLIQRSYRDDVPSSCIERFLPLVLEIEEEGQQVTPCFSNQGINFMHIRHSNLYRE